MFRLTPPKVMDVRPHLVSVAHVLVDFMHRCFCVSHPHRRCNPLVCICIRLVELVFIDNVAVFQEAIYIVIHPTLQLYKLFCVISAKVEQRSQHQVIAGNFQEVLWLTKPVENCVYLLGVGWARSPKVVGSLLIRFLAEALLMIITVRSPGPSPGFSTTAKAEEGACPPRALRRNIATSEGPIHADLLSSST
jgi:hypothetical protein